MDWRRKRFRKIYGKIRKLSIKIWGNGIDNGGDCIYINDVGNFNCRWGNKWRNNDF